MSGELERRTNLDPLWLSKNCTDEQKTVWFFKKQPNFVNPPVSFWQATSSNLEVGYLPKINWICARFEPVGICFSSIVPNPCDILLI